MTELAEKLEPCPFCGTGRVRLAQVVDFHFVKCDFCGNEGLKDDDKAEAIAAWNRRTIVPVIQEPAPIAGSGSDGMPIDIIALVLAARAVAFGGATPEALTALDAASEAFASRVPWDDEPLSASPRPQATKDDDWRADPSADERWNAGLDFGMQQFCAVLGVDPKTVNWDAATETLDGDVQSVLCGIGKVRFGEDWPHVSPTPQPVEAAPVAWARRLAEKLFVEEGNREHAARIIQNFLYASSVPHPQAVEAAPERVCRCDKCGDEVIIDVTVPWRLMKPKPVASPNWKRR